MKLIPVFFFILWFSIGGIRAQEIPVNQPYVVNDSIKQLRERQLKEWEEEKAHRQAVARKKFFEKLKKLNPDSVIKINIKNLGLTKMPDLRRFYRLKKINASGNKIKHFRKRDFKIDSLETIVLSDNPIKTVCLPRGSRIKNVVIHNCDLKKIPRSVRKLKKIETVDFSKNRIKHIPRFFKNREILNEVNLNFNRIKFNKRAVKRLSKVKKVLLAGNKISFLPENINQMTGVRKLNLADNRLTKLPAEFALLDSLETIIFYKNSFSEIPKEVFHLSNLVELDFYYNRLTVVPDEFDKLPKLIRIYLSFNNIEVIPESISKLKNLHSLYIHHNKLKIIPDCIIDLPSLKVFDVGYNQLISIPDLSSMNSLEEVDLQNNNLEEIPWDLLVKPNIKRVFLRDNPFIDEGNLEMLKKMVSKQATKGVEIYIN